MNIYSKKCIKIKSIMHSNETKKDKRIDGKRVNFYSMDVQLSTYRVKWEMRHASFHPAKVENSIKMVHVNVNLPKATIEE